MAGSRSDADAGAATSATAPSGAASIRRSIDGRGDRGCRTDWHVLQWLPLSRMKTDVATH